MTQPCILSPISKHARFVELSLISDKSPREALRCLQNMEIDDNLLIGLGASFLSKLEKNIDGFHEFPSKFSGTQYIPSTQADLMIRIEHDDCGFIAEISRNSLTCLSEYFKLERQLECFKYDEGLDLSGYVDGTENPEGHDAKSAAILNSDDQNLTGSSFITLQKWQHDLHTLKSKPQEDQDNIIGRRLSDNEELDDAPNSAHVKRTAQESFSPEAFMLRRSMPWSDINGEGLHFVSFANSLYPFETQLNRMIGGEDEIIDRIFEFSKPITGAHYWCPPKVGKSINYDFLE